MTLQGREGKEAQGQDEEEGRIGQLGNWVKLIKDEGRNTKEKGKLQREIENKAPTANNAFSWIASIDYMVVLEKGVMD